MAFQKTVIGLMALGVPGTLYDDSFHRATTWKLAKADLDKPCIGRVFTFDASGNPRLGGTGKFAGIFTAPQAAASSGLDPSLSAVGLDGVLTDVGRVIVTTNAAVTAGKGVQYNTTTGEISGAPTTAGNTAIPGATFFKFDAEAGGVAVIALASA